MKSTRTMITILASITFITGVGAYAMSGADVEIDQVGLRFTKSDVTLPVGATLHFHNSDDVTHNIMIIDGEDEVDDKGMQKPGEVIAVKMDQVGTYQTRCSIHPKMKMLVTVTGQSKP